MNVALIALPCIGKLPAPPLTLAYIATLLEQRRHIVRIYDLALDPQAPLSTAFQPLRSFRPQVLVVAGEQPDMLSAAVDALHEDRHQHVLPVQMSRSSLDVNQICSGAIQWIDSQRGSPAGPAEPPAGVTSIDGLPFPARHLLSLESYDLRAVGGELQTIVLVAGLDSAGSGKIALRSPTQIVAELRSVSQEFGLRHYLFPDVSITADRAWLVELLTRLCDARLNIGWEASADADQLDEALSAHMARAGCEAITLHLRAASVFELAGVRSRVRQAVTTAREQGVFVRAHVRLEPPYEFGAAPGGCGGDIQPGRCALRCGGRRRGGRGRRRPAGKGAGPPDVRRRARPPALHQPVRPGPGQPDLEAQRPARRAL